jgi:hypothetical protein
MLLNFSDFLGCMFFLPIFIYVEMAFLDGIGLTLRDPFYFSRNRKR